MLIFEVYIKLNHFQVVKFVVKMDKTGKVRGF